jgi:hypothetical protein
MKPQCNGVFPQRNGALTATDRNKKKGFKKIENLKSILESLPLF